MQTTRTLLKFSALVVLLVRVSFAAPDRTAPIDPHNPPQGRFSDDWMEIYMAGGKVGYGHSTMARDGDLISTAMQFHMKVGRVDQPVTIEVMQQTRETLAGVPVSFGSETNMSIMKSATKGTVNDGKVTIVTSQYGMEQTQTYDFPAGAMMAWGTFRESLLKGFKPGTKYTLSTFAPEMRLDGPVTAATTIGEWEDFTHRGRTLRGQRVNVVLESPIGSFEMVSWVDRDGTPLKAKVPMPGLGDIEMLTVDQATALAEFVPPEFFMTTTIPAKRKIDRAASQRIRYRVTAKNPDASLGELPTTDMQNVTTNPDRSMEVTVTRQPHAPCGPSPSEGAARKGPAPDLAEYLEGNLMINTADPKLIELAKQAGDGENEPFGLGDKLRRFVTDYVETKSLNIGFATASEVARTKEGDCSEHGVLLAALGRLNGLPSRVVVGLAYVPIFGNQDDIFGYHMWTQFYIDGRWVDFDAALRESDCSPARIAFAVSSLKHSGLADLSLPLISKIGAIDIQILDVEPVRPRPD